MGTYLNPGNSGFEEIRHGTYIDKTGLISLINQSINTLEKLTCVSRPRRFGKSLAAKMLCAYYDKTCDSSSLFQDLVIARDDQYLQHLNKYDVIYLDMAGIIGETDITDIISYIRKNITRELAEAYPKLTVTEGFIPTLVRAAEAAGNKFIMIIDEWDAPIREAARHPDIRQSYLGFLRSLFKNSGATSQIFAAAYMTGILPIRKDGFQSAVSDFREFTVLNPGKFAVYTGFTEQEVQCLCQQYHLDFAAARHWYDGYSFEELDSVYNPYSVMCAMQNHSFRSYWKKTSAAESLLTYIDMNEDGLQEDIARLISGETLVVDTDGFENDFETFRDKNDVLTLLIHLGYLSYREEEPGSGIIRIPNEEIRIEFHKILRRGKHTKLVRLIRLSDELLKKTIQGDMAAVANAIAQVHDSNYAPQFYNDEQALRAVVRYAYISCVDQYSKIEELPSGHGCADIVYLPGRRSALPAMMIELKWNQTAESAIAQIKDRNYPEVLKNYGGPLLLVGISYHARTKVHTCVIESLHFNS